ncbi:MAG: hypothetical protein J6C89_05950, partial [Clostridia bacterium]|nr:hypothetical protein [Clostridia bacterium]
MRYKIEYLSREKDVLLRILEGEEHLADIKTAWSVAKELCFELGELYEELSRCIRALEDGIRNIQMQIGQAQQAARQAQMRAAQANAKLASTPTQKTVYPSKEEAANGARPKQVPANVEEIGRLKSEIAQCKAQEAR